MTEVHIKYFTVAEANKTLPLVRQIVKDILDNGFQLRTIAESRGGEVRDSEEAQKLISELDKYYKELEDIGCFFKDWNFSFGLVDFPALIENEEVLLCWRSDEESIKYYHKINDGYAGRQEIPADYL